MVGAAALLPVTAYAVSDKRARPLAALLWHQTEEWVWPGGFLPWINRAVLDYPEDEFPLDRRTGFWVNVGFGWGLSALAFAAKDAPAPAAALYVSHLGNAGLHVGWAIKKRRRDPGLISAATMLLPVGVLGLRELVKDGSVSRKQLAAGIAAGTVLSAALAPAMKLKIRRRRRAHPRDHWTYDPPAG
ncbi:MAG: HXXEE domain-containing protein [Thermoleophilaceae bacterium]|nr:HXXEE domain-containing protein [Thermoleophilaceae bacterium]